MHRLWIGNFDFEHELATERPAARADLRRITDELAFAWLGVADPEDLIATRHLPDAQFLESLSSNLSGPVPQFRTGLQAADPPVVPTPWGWSRSIVGELRRRGAHEFVHPDLDVVRRVNSREFSINVENQIDGGLEEVRFARSLEELRLALQRLADLEGPHARWVLKANHSNSSRERLVGRGAELSVAQLQWADRRVTRDGGVAVEPWLDIVAEAGLQWEIHRGGGIELIGIVPQLVSARGEYRGSWFAPPAALQSEWEGIVAASYQAVETIAASGYFGPVGIDACRYRDRAGQLRLRAVQDINARWTMGRLSLGWRRQLRPGETGCWRIEPVGPATTSTASPARPQTVRRIPTTPEVLAGQKVRLRQSLEFTAADS